VDPGDTEGRAGIVVEFELGPKSFWTATTQQIALSDCDMGFADYTDKRDFKANT
jgi:hypothetical protein